MIETNKFYNADCLDILKTLPDKSIDLVLTDPPYNVNKEYNTYNDNLDVQEYKNFSILWFNECKRVSKNILFTIGNNNLKLWFEIETPDYVYIWYKSNTMLSSKYCQIAVYEPVLFYGDIVKKPIRDVFDIAVIPQKEADFHSCPKQIKLWKILLKEFSNENDLILDCFSGSGTTAIACHNLNRRFICIEKDKEYYEKSVLRYENHIKQLKLIQ